MKSYEKPIAIAMGEAEGIYAASGPAGIGTTNVSDTVSNKDFTYRLSQTNAWEGHKQYNIWLMNNTDKEVKSITVTVNVSGTVSSISGNVTGTPNGDHADITFNNYGNGMSIGANTTVGPLYMEVTGSGDFSLE